MYEKEGQKHSWPPMKLSKRKQRKRLLLKNAIKEKLRFLPQNYYFYLAKQRLFSVDIATLGPVVYAKLLETDINNSKNEDGGNVTNAKVETSSSAGQSFFGLFARAFSNEIEGFNNDSSDLSSIEQDKSGHKKEALKLISLFKGQENNDPNSVQKIVNENLKENKDNSENLSAGILTMSNQIKTIDIGSKLEEGIVKPIDHTDIQKLQPPMPLLKSEDSLSSNELKQNKILDTNIGENISTLSKLENVTMSKPTENAFPLLDTKDKNIQKGIGEKHDQIIQSGTGFLANLKQSLAGDGTIGKHIFTAREVPKTVGPEAGEKVIKHPDEKEDSSSNIEQKPLDFTSPKETTLASEIEQNYVISENVGEQPLIPLILKTPPVIIKSTPEASTTQTPGITDNIVESCIQETFSKELNPNVFSGTQQVETSKVASSDSSLKKKAEIASHINEGIAKPSVTGSDVVKKPDWRSSYRIKSPNRIRSPKRVPPPDFKSPGRVKSPMNLTKSPVRVNKSPSRVSKSPNRVNKSPNRVNKSPNRANKSPNKVSRSPTRDGKSPNKVTMSPNRKTKSPDRARSPIRPTSPNIKPLRNKAKVNGTASPTGSPTSGKSNNNNDVFEVKDEYAAMYLNAKFFSNFKQNRSQALKSNKPKPKPIVKKTRNYKDVLNLKNLSNVLKDEQVADGEAAFLNANFFSNFTQNKSQIPRKDNIKPKPDVKKSYYISNTKNLVKSTSFKQYILSLGTRLNQDVGSGLTLNRQDSLAQGVNLPGNSGDLSKQNLTIDTLSKSLNEGGEKHKVFGNSNNEVDLKADVNEIIEKQDTTQGTTEKNVINMEQDDKNVETSIPSDIWQSNVDLVDSLNQVQTQLDINEGEDSDYQMIATMTSGPGDQCENPDNFMESLDCDVKSEDHMCNKKESCLQSSDICKDKEKEKELDSDIGFYKAPDEIQPTKEPMIDVRPDPSIDVCIMGTEKQMLEDVLESAKHEISLGLSGNREKLNALDNAVKQLKQELANDINTVFTTEQLNTLHNFKEQSSGLKEGDPIRPGPESWLSKDVPVQKVADANIESPKELSKEEGINAVNVPSMSELDTDLKVHSNPEKSSLSCDTEQSSFPGLLTLEEDPKGNCVVTDQQSNTSNEFNPNRSSLIIFNGSRDDEIEAAESKSTPIKPSKCIEVENLENNLSFEHLSYMKSCDSIKNACTDCGISDGNNSIHLKSQQSTDASRSNIDETQIENRSIAILDVKPNILEQNIIKSSSVDGDIVPSIVASHLSDDLPEERINRLLSKTSYKDMPIGKKSRKIQNKRRVLGKHIFSNHIAKPIAFLEFLNTLERRPDDLNSETFNEYDIPRTDEANILSDGERSLTLENPGFDNDTKIVRGKCHLSKIFSGLMDADPCNDYMGENEYEEWGVADKDSFSTGILNECISQRTPTTYNAEGYGLSYPGDHMDDSEMIMPSNSISSLIDIKASINDFECQQQGKTLISKSSPLPAEECSFFGANLGKFFFDGNCMEENFAAADVGIDVKNTTHVDSSIGKSLYLKSKVNKTSSRKSRISIGNNKATKKPSTFLNTTKGDLGQRLYSDQEREMKDNEREKRLTFISQLEAGKRNSIINTQKEELPPYRVNSSADYSIDRKRRRSTPITRNATSPPVVQRSASNDRRQRRLSPSPDRERSVQFYIADNSPVRKSDSFGKISRSESNGRLASERTNSIDSKFPNKSNSFQKNPFNNAHVFNVNKAKTQSKSLNKKTQRSKSIDGKRTTLSSRFDKTNNIYQGNKMSPFDRKEKETVKAKEHRGSVDRAETLMQKVFEVSKKIHERSDHSPAPPRFDEFIVPAKEETTKRNTSSRSRSTSHSGIRCPQVDSFEKQNALLKQQEYAQRGESGVSTDNAMPFIPTSPNKAKPVNRRSRDKALTFRVSSIGRHKDREPAKVKEPKSDLTVVCSEKVQEAEKSTISTLKEYIFNYLVDWKKKNDGCYTYNVGTVDIQDNVLEQESNGALQPSITEPTVYQSEHDIIPTDNDGGNGPLLPTLSEIVESSSEIAVPCVLEPSSVFEHDVKRAFTWPPKEIKAEETTMSPPEIESPATVSPPYMVPILDNVRNIQTVEEHEEIQMPCVEEPTMTSPPESASHCHTAVIVSNVKSSGSAFACEALVCPSDAIREPTITEPCMEEEVQTLHTILPLNEHYAYTYSSSVDGPPVNVSSVYVNDTTTTTTLENEPPTILELESQNIIEPTVLDKDIECVESEAVDNLSNAEIATIPIMQETNYSDLPPISEESSTLKYEEECCNGPIFIKDFTPSPASSSQPTSAQTPEQSASMIPFKQDEMSYNVSPIEQESSKLIIQKDEQSLIISPRIEFLQSLSPITNDVFKRIELQNSLEQLPVKESDVDGYLTDITAQSSTHQSLERSTSVDNGCAAFDINVANDVKDVSSSSCLRKGEKIIQSLMEEDVEIQSVSRMAPTKSYSLPSKRQTGKHGVDLPDVTEKDSSVAIDDTLCEGSEYAHSVASEIQEDEYGEKVRNVPVSDHTNTSQNLDKRSLDKRYSEFLERQCDCSNDELDKKISEDMEIVGGLANKEYVQYSPSTKRSSTVVNPQSKWWRSFYGSRREKSPNPNDFTLKGVPSESSFVYSSKSKLFTTKGIPKLKRNPVVSQNQNFPWVKAYQKKGKVLAAERISRKTSSKNISLNRANSDHSRLHSAHSGSSNSIKIDTKNVTCNRAESSDHSLPHPGCKGITKKKDTTKAFQRDIKKALALEEKIVKNVEMGALEYDTPTFDLCPVFF